ncbi:cilia- and flagella-associated protein 300-like [Patiria miniata]|uniref:Cilia- and flagella-associated protein 300 n=1 Tax=Patiria miniata TaxID=46514 RepID=A0A913ZIC0_PATMI|nr:cilia- and flagella-associated protein 300-like [Patiria miniata]
MSADAKDDKRDAMFTFQQLEGKTCKALQVQNVQDLLMKWSMKGRISAQYYSFDALFQSYHKDAFALDFLQSQNVKATLQVLSDSNTWCPVGHQAHKVEANPVQCSVTSMKFFDRLYDEGIVRESGSIVKCLDEYHEEFQISDELRKMLLVEDSDNYDIFSDSERQEFFFLLFQHLCLGGQVCQFEDDIKPYLDTAKSLYKELISVQKDSSTQQLRVTSLVYQLKAQDQTGYQYYPCDKDHPQTFAYLIIDPLKRHVAVFYHKFGGGVFS